MEQHEDVVVPHQGAQPSPTAPVPPPAGEGTGISTAHSTPHRQRLQLQYTDFCVCMYSAALSPDVAVNMAPGDHTFVHIRKLHVHLHVHMWREPYPLLIVYTTCRDSRS